MSSRHAATSTPRQEDESDLKHTKGFGLDCSQSPSDQILQTHFDGKIKKKKI